VDVLGGLDEIPVCTQYLMPDGSTIRDVIPSQADELARAQPVYERLAGWPAFHPRLKERIRREGPSALPSTLRRYLDRIMEETRVPVQFVGYGADREETVSLPPPTEHLRRASLTPWTG